MSNKVQDTVSAVAALALAACAVQPVSGPAQAAPQEISQTAQAALGESATPANPAEELGQKLLKLIGDLKAKEDFTLDRVSKTLGVEIPESRRWPGTHEAALPLNDLRIALIQFEPASNHSGELLNFTIIRSENDESTGTFPLTDACLEFEPFAHALEQSGYAREARRAGLYGEPGILTGDLRFYRRKPDSEYDHLDLASETLFPLKGAGPVEISISSPGDELIDANGNDAGGRKCIVNLEIEVKGGDA